MKSSSRNYEGAGARRSWLFPGRFGLLALLVLLEGCYYAQAVHGHLDVMQRRRPLDDVLADASVSDAVKARLRVVREARHFAAEELGLPDNGSYRSYADLEREYVVWNVFAAPEFSLEPKRWCFPVAGCVAYRGYFREQSARNKAAALRARGYDVAVGGVAAYSTLGRFEDPLLNTMMRWKDTDIILTLFHELAHQELYVKGDTQFNESFASAVAEIGIERWLAREGDTATLARFRDNREVRQAMLEMVAETRDELADLYASGVDPGVMRREKRRLLDALSADAERWLASRETETVNWLRGPLNNATLVSLGLYEGWLPAFRSLYQDCDEDLPCFYRAAAEVAELPEDIRAARLGVMAAAR